MIKETDLENKDATRFEVPGGYKPKTLQDSIEWHLFALAQMQKKANEAGQALREAQLAQINTLKEEEAKSQNSAVFKSVPLDRSNMFVVEWDDHLRDLERQWLYYQSEVTRLQKKIAVMRELQEDGYEIHK